MAPQPDLVGTVTLTSGQLGFTVAGINMVAADVQPGDQILLPAKGLVLTIGARTNATTGALAVNCPAAAAGSAQPCRIHYQSDLARVAAQTRNLIELIGSGNVEALAGLTLAANKGIRATGAGALVTYDLTAFGVALAGLTGANGKIPVATAAGAAAMRDIVGTVSQSGGTPTGALIERGANANGEYVRLADGTQMCWNLLNAGPITLGSGSYNDPWRTAAVNFTFPATFAAVPAYSLFCYRNDGTANARISYGAYAQNPATTASVANIRGMMVSSTAADVNIVCTAMGRWF